jgi:hypothetical protein
LGLNATPLSHLFNFPYPEDEVIVLGVASIKLLAVLHDERVTMNANEVSSFRMRLDERVDRAGEDVDLAQAVTEDGEFVLEHLIGLHTIGACASRHHIAAMMLTDELLNIQIGCFGDEGEGENYAIAACPAASAQIDHLKCVNRHNADRVGAYRTNGKPLSELLLPRQLGAAIELVKVVLVALGLTLELPGIPVLFGDLIEQVGGGLVVRGIAVIAHELAGAVAIDEIEPVGLVATGELDVETCFVTRDALEHEAVKDHVGELRLVFTVVDRDDRDASLDEALEESGRFRAPVVDDLVVHNE